MSFSKTIKVSLLRDSHDVVRFVYERTEEQRSFGKAQMDPLIRQILQKYPEFSFKNLRMFWVDEDIDWITIRSCRDMESYLAICRDKNRKPHVLVCRRDHMVALMKGFQRAFVQRYRNGLM